MGQKDNEWIINKIETLEAENAALKEQVAQLINHNARLESSASAIMDKMQSKSASLVDALESINIWKIQDALAAFKEQS